MESLRLKKSVKKGWGVFAGRSFRKGEIIEVCPCLILSENDSKKADKTKLEWYGFYSNCGKRNVYPFGYGMIYNHSFEPNLDWRLNQQKKVMTFIALRDIKKGEELVHNYRYDKSKYFFLNKREVENYFKNNKGA